MDYLDKNDRKLLQSIRKVRIGKEKSKIVAEFAKENNIPLINVKLPRRIHFLEEKT